MCKSITSVGLYFSITLQIHLRPHLAYLVVLVHTIRRSSKKKKNLLMKILERCPAREGPKKKVSIDENITRLGIFRELTMWQLNLRAHIFQPAMPTYILCMYMYSYLYSTYIICRVNSKSALLLSTYGTRGGGGLGKGALSQLDFYYYFILLGPLLASIRSGPSESAPLFDCYHIPPG